MSSSLSPAPPIVFDLPENRVFITIIHSLAILITILRLARRIRIKRFSWDDGWAALAASLVVVYLILDWVKWALVQDRRTSMEAARYAKEDRTIISVVSALSLGAIWSSRISLALSIARILPPSRLRTSAVALSVGCGVMGCATLAEKMVVFNAPILQKEHIVQLRIIGTFQIVGDVIASLVLLILPLYALWNSSSLPSTERRLILVLFTSTFLTLMASCAQTACTIVKKDGRGLSYTINLQIAISVMVCNFLVVITMLFRLLFRRRRGAQDKPSEEEEESGEDYNSGEHTIGFISTRSRTQDFVLTTISTYDGPQFTGVEEMQTYSLRSCRSLGTSTTVRNLEDEDRKG
ncbi:hypothetical protein V5O48_008442 [Marasmius crinis-equi]|uniref:Integral membrane protein n=1 Tax=Marasmius crinis-equi TaxID=585013 RepID=A0ABR3FDW1_9AGAR